MKNTSLSSGFLIGIYLKYQRLVLPAITSGLTSFIFATTASAQAVDGGDRPYHYYWNDWYFGWGWVLWFGFLVLIFSSFGNWGYSYHAHQKYDALPRKQALDILDERYARGEITREQFAQLRTDISRA